MHSSNKLFIFYISLLIWNLRWGFSLFYVSCSCFFIPNKVDSIFLKFYSKWTISKTAVMVSSIFPSFLFNNISSSEKKNSFSTFFCYLIYFFHPLTLIYFFFSPSLFFPFKGSFVFDPLSWFLFAPCNSIFLLLWSKKRKKKKKKRVMIKYNLAWFQKIFSRIFAYFTQVVKKKKLPFE